MNCLNQSISNLVKIFNLYVFNANDSSSWMLLGLTITLLTRDAVRQIMPHLWYFYRICSCLLRKRSLWCFNRSTRCIKSKTLSGKTSRIIVIKQERMKCLEWWGTDQIMRCSKSFWKYDLCVCECVWYDYKSYPCSCPHSSKRQFYFWKKKNKTMTTSHSHLLHFQVR